MLNMMANTHLIIARHVYSNLNLEEKKIINYKNFLYGNIKPDMVSTYKFKKHYMDESLDMILDKIKALSALSDNEVNRWISISRFSQELGVICHFLTDFFCVPHSERWEFKHSLNKHVKYERDLGIYAKTVRLPRDRTKIFGCYNVSEFIIKTQKLYLKRKSFFNDLSFASYICNSVVDYIVDSIEFNSSVGITLLK